MGFVMNLLTCYSTHSIYNLTDMLNTTITSLVLSLLTTKIVLSGQDEKIDYLEIKTQMDFRTMFQHNMWCTRIKPVFIRKEDEIILKMSGVVKR